MTLEDWVKKIGYGTTSKGRAELIDKCQDYCLIRIKHPGGWGGRQRLPGYTEWFVCLTFAAMDSWGNVKGQLWKHEGRLTKEIAKTLGKYGLGSTLKRIKKPL